jgi:hypothetical protein
MAAEQLMTRRSTIAVIAVLYALLSLVAFASGGRAIGLILLPLGSIGAVLWFSSFLAVHCLLGPFAILAYATRGWAYPMSEWTIVTPALVLYAVATILLICACALVTRKNRIVRWSGYAFGTIVWIGSGLLMSFTQIYGG